MSKIFDTHAHYDDERFSNDLDVLLSSMVASNVDGIITCGVDIESSYAAAKISERYPFVYFSAGYHPENIPEDNHFDCDTLTRLVKNDKCVAIGEIGLDYHWDTTLKTEQNRFFEEQLILANEQDMPVIIHSRDAAADTLTLVQKHKPKGVMHCFSGSAEMAAEYLKLGLYLGFGGAVTFKNARHSHEVISTMPLDRLLLETDCPYMAPEPFRGKRNDSSMVKFVAEKIGEIRGISANEILSITNYNARRLFGI